MTKNPSDTIYWNDLENDRNLKACSFAAQGLWLRMLCIMASATPYGELRIDREPIPLDQLVNLVGGEPKVVKKLFDELGKMGVYSLTRAGVPYNRRMKRKRTLSETRAKAGSKGGQSTRSKQKTNGGLPQQSEQQTGQQNVSKPRATSSSSLSSPSSSIEINNKDFPEGSIRFTPWETIAIEHGSGWDIGIIAAAFRSWAEGKEIKQSNLIKTFTTFCRNYSKRNGAP